MSIEHRAVAAGLDHAARVCDAHGVRLTALRKTVLQLVLQSPSPLTAYKLLDQLKALRTSAVPPTIYRALDFLVGNGLIHKIERLNAFVACADREHGHHDAQFLICGKCGTVAEIEDDEVTRALAKAAALQGFRPEHAVVELDGLCASCSA